MFKNSEYKTLNKLLICGYTPYLVDFAGILNHDGFEILIFILPDNRHSELMDHTLDYLKEAGFPFIYQPPAEAFADLVSRLKPDMLFCFSHTRKIPGAVLAVENVRKVNCHLGLLPEYRCLNPVNRAIINGDTITGFTIHELVDEMDAGDIYYRETVPLDREDTALDVTLRLIGRLKVCLPSILRDIYYGKLRAVPQDQEKAHYYPPIDYFIEGLLDWNRPGDEIMRKIRAFAPPWPGAFFYLEEKKIIVEKAFFLPGEKASDPGLKKRLEGKIIACCRDGEIIIEKYHLLRD